MKRMLFVAALMAALPWGASAQVEKRVEVTKAYVPSVEGASKLAVVPDMTDTVKMRPEIDYTITPLPEEKNTVKKTENKNRHNNNRLK